MGSRSRLEVVLKEFGIELENCICGTITAATCGTVTAVEIFPRFLSLLEFAAAFRYGYSAQWQIANLARARTINQSILHHS